MHPVEEQLLAVVVDLDLEAIEGETGDVEIVAVAVDVRVYSSRHQDLYLMTEQGDAEARTRMRRRSGSQLRSSVVSSSRER
jgi:hypothetical protein